MTETYSILFDQASVHYVLERIRQAEPIGVTPLRNLVWLRRQIEAQGPQPSLAAIETALSDALARLVEQNLSTLRLLEGVIQTSPIQTRASVLNVLRQDFAHSNDELEAWSVLYHRYVRLDLNLQVQDIANTLRTNARLINRRQGHGFYRLTEYLSRLEAEARSRNRRLWLTLKLPSPAYNSLFGIENSLSHLLELLNTAPPYAVALIGPGGIGKTTLARAAANAIIESERFADIVWLSLDTPTSYSSLLAMIAKSLGYLHLVSTSELELETSLWERLKTTPSLIILDNADALEQPSLFLSRLSTFVEPGRLLVTMRIIPAPDTPIHIFPVHPLPSDALTALLRETARLRRIPQADLLDQTRIDAILKAVGGNPLAGRLVISSLASLPLERVLERLPTLQIEHGEALFDALYARAWQSLDDSARLTLIALSLMPSSGASWSELHELLDLTSEELDNALMNLNTASLIEAIGTEPSYLIHTLTRQFVSGQAIEPQWKEPTRDLLRGIVQRRSENMDRLNAEETPGNGAAYNIRLLQLQTKLGEPIEIVSDLISRIAPSVRRSGQWTAWREMLYTVLDYLSPAPVNRIHRARTLLELGVAARWLSDRNEALEAFEQAIELFGNVGDFTGQAEALIEAGQLHETLGNTNPAFDCYLRAVKVAGRFRDRTLFRRALNSLARLALLNNLVEQALGLLSIALKSFEKDEPDGQTLSQLGAVYLQLGDLDKALSTQEAALDALREVGDLPRLARAHLRMGIACHAATRSEEAHEHLQIGLDLMRTLGDAFGEARLLTSLGTFYADWERWQEALYTWKEALAFQERLGDPAGKATTLFNIADLYWKLDRVKEGRGVLEEARKLAERNNVVMVLDQIKLHPMNPANDQTQP